jgi:hypothetical protein
MSNLIPISQTSLKSLSPDELAAIEADNGKKIKDYSEDELGKRLVEIVSQAYILRGHKIEHETLSITVVEFALELMKCFTTFTLETVLQAVRAGSLGKLEDESVHVSTHNLCRWVNLYNDKIRREAIHKAKQQEKEIEVSEEKKQEQLKKLDESIEQARNTKNWDKSLDWYYAIMYDRVNKSDDLLTREEKDKIFESVEKELEKESVTPNDQYYKRFNPSDYLNKLQGAKVTRAKMRALEFIFKNNRA